MSTGRSKPRVSNGKVAALCLVITAAMVGAGFAAVPFYRAFCQATGFDGTISSTAAVAPGTILDKTVTVRFDTNTNGVPWTFKPEVASQTVRIGATSLTHFTVKNEGKTPITAQAAFNILPEGAGPYFKKTECFCFQEQTLKPGESQEYAVV